LVRIVGLILTLAIALSACDQIKTDKDLLPGSTGKYGEVLVVVDTSLENGATGKLLNEIFNKAQPALPKLEPQFRVSTVAPESFKSILKRGRNIVKISVGKGKSSATQIEKDVWAKDQLLINITASDDAKVAEILEKNIENIRAHFNEKEIERLIKRHKLQPYKEVISEVKDLFGYGLTIPPGFEKMEAFDNGIWLQKEKFVGKHQVIQGILIYKYDYTSDSTFSVGELIQKRNLFTESRIEGTRDSSFMVVYDEYKPDQLEINLNDLYTMESRGLWRMENDFMGGPFLHYTFVDEENNSVINLDGFVYAPGLQKREYLRELEAIFKSLKS